jgi:hypothetical protein
MMTPAFSAAIIASILFAPLVVAFDCSFSTTYPRQYVAYKVPDSTDLVVDGTLQSPAWQEVPFSEGFVDISTATSPRLSTHVKIRWNSEYIFVGAHLEEPQVWANISTTCHCINATQDQVIFHDNDFEIFTDPAGTTHSYKEYEMNAANATWDLLLNKPYDDGGGENSSRVFGPAGWDMQPPLHARTHVWGTINDPSASTTGWSVEVALPIAKLLDNTTGVPPSDGAFWRINFSRVEWAVAVVEGRYWKEPSCQSCPVPGTAVEDNWVWSPQGSIAMHLPEKWGMLQFSAGTVNTTAPVWNREWPVRSVAAAVYYAQHAYAGAHNGTYATAPLQLLPFVADAAIVDGTCTGGAPITFSGAGGAFTALIPPNPFGEPGKSASITQDRYLQVFQS